MSGLLSEPVVSGMPYIGISPDTVYGMIAEKTEGGVPPLSFKCYDSELKNYRIYGNTVSGESVGDPVIEGEHTGEYHVPVTITNGTDTETVSIYLDEQLKKVGDEAEYIDYAEQKRHFADGTSIDAALPALQTLKGTNTLSVGTAVQPSRVEITGKVT